MSKMISGRRKVLAALCAWVFAYAVPAFAQDPQLSLAKTAALDWLALADAGDASGTYVNATQRFRATMPMENWAGVLKTARDNYGAVTSRTSIAVTRPEPSKDIPPGEFALVAFRTEFAKRSTGTETLTMEREPDGKWRVVGYMMK